MEPKLEGIDSGTRFGAARPGRSAGAVLDRETTLDDDDMAVVREMTGTSGDSLAMLAERETIHANGASSGSITGVDEPTIDIDSDSSL